MVGPQTLHVDDAGLCFEGIKNGPCFLSKCDTQNQMQVYTYSDEDGTLRPRDFPEFCVTGSTVPHLDGKISLAPCASPPSKLQSWNFLKHFEPSVNTQEWGQCYGPLNLKLQ